MGHGPRRPCLVHFDLDRTSSTRTSSEPRSPTASTSSLLKLDRALDPLKVILSPSTRNCLHRAHRLRCRRSEEQLNNLYWQNPNGSTRRNFLKGAGALGVTLTVGPGRARGQS